MEIQEYANITELDAATLNRLIKEIVVHNHSQKVLSCRYNMDINRVEARFEDGTILSIDCIVIEDEYGNTPAQRAELDWLLI